MQNKFDSVERFFKIFELDTVEQYVKLSREKEKLAAFADVKRQYQDHEAKFGREYNEMFTYIMDELMKLPHEERKNQLSKKFPFLELRMLKVIAAEHNEDELKNNFP